MVIHLLAPKQKKERQRMSVSDASKTVMPGTREPQLVFDKHTPIPETANKIEDSGPIFPDSSTNLLPLVEVALADSGVESLNEMRQHDELLAQAMYVNTIIQQHNTWIRDLFANKIIRAVRLDDDGKILVVEVKEGSLQCATTRWSLAHARRVIPGNWYEEISDKVIGILQDLNVSEKKDPRIIEANAERASREAKQRAVMSYEERLNALRSYNSMLELQCKSKILLGLKVENAGQNITLVMKSPGRSEKITWTFDRDGRLF